MTDTKKAKNVVAKSFRDFKTVSRADDPANTKPLNVVIPGVGDTGEKLYIRSRYCSEYREAELKSQRQLLALMQGSEEVSDTVKEDIMTRSLSSLVAGWTFSEPPTVENVFDFLLENPTVRDDINVFAAKDSNFF